MDTKSDTDDEQINEQTRDSSEHKHQYLEAKQIKPPIDNLTIIVIPTLESSSKDTSAGQCSLLFLIPEETSKPDHQNLVDYSSNEIQQAQNDKPRSLESI